MSIFSNSSSNPIAITWQLLKMLKVKVHAKTVKLKLEAHPEYPSLLAISDCLSDWKISNQAYQIDRKDYNVNDLLFPFLAHLPERGGRFILVQHIKEGIVTFSDEDHKKASLTEAVFLQRWDGIALHAEANAESGEKDHHQSRIQYGLQTLVLPLSLILLLGTFYMQFSDLHFSWSYFSLALIKFTGLATSVLLLIQSVNSSNPFIQNLCGLAGKNDCNAILKSDAAKVTAWLSWSEVGFFYFSGSFLLLLFNPEAFVFLAWLNLLTLPYTIYSITYQYSNKNWCILCCSIQALLWLEFLVFLSSASHTSGLKPTTSYLFPFAFLSPILIWAFLKPFFLNAAQLKPLQQQLKKFKYNRNLFHQALTSQPRYAVHNNLMPIIMGNPAAETTITVVSNPYCGPCGKAHATIEEWLNARNDLQIKILFTTADRDDDNRTKMARHVTALSMLHDRQQVKLALHEWYIRGNKNFETWAERFPVTFNGEVKAVTKIQKDWCEMAEISFTPTILVNGYKLPEPYRLEDIRYLLT